MDSLIPNVVTPSFQPTLPESVPFSLKIVVEDYHSIYLEVFALFLRNNGFSVIGLAHNGLELMESIDPNALPDIAIINYKTSKPESFDAARWCKSHYPAVKVVINTQFNNRLPFAEMKRLGIEGVIIKANHDSTQIINALHMIYHGGNFYPENCPAL